MDQDSVIQYITGSFAGLNVAEANGDYFFIYDPNRDLEPSRQIPFATLITNDRYDQVSALDRPGVYRLNIGVSRQTFESLFGKGESETQYDYTALDTFMPHPEYGRMHYLCVLNPSAETWEIIKPMLAEAYAIVVDRVARRPARSDEKSTAN